MPPSVTYRQLEGEPLALLQAACERLGSITAAARALGYGRPSISMALAGRYPADTGRLAAEIIERFAAGISCPHLGRDITHAECCVFRDAPLSTVNRDSVLHWQACRTCPHNLEAERCS